MTDSLGARPLRRDTVGGRPVGSAEVERAPSHATWTITDKPSDRRLPARPRLEQPESAGGDGAFLVAASLLPLAWNVVRSLRGPKVAGDDPWEGNSLEWVTSSPPPHHNIDQTPQIRSERPAFDLRHSRKHTGLDFAPSEQV
jgi:hypothetical protein